MLHQHALGRLIAWTHAETKGLLRMRYLLPFPVDTRLFLAIPDSQIRVQGARVRSSVCFAGQRIWMEATLGERELSVSFEKLGARSPDSLVNWFEEGLEEFTGCRTMSQDTPSPRRRQVLPFAA